MPPTLGHVRARWWGGRTSWPPWLEVLDELCGHDRTELERLLRALEGIGRPGAQADSEDQRYPTYRALRALVDRMASRGPLLLVLDDLHWADRASIELLSFLHTLSWARDGARGTSSFDAGNVRPRVLFTLHRRERQGPTMLSSPPS